jgi:hypothetical protein
MQGSSSSLRFPFYLLSLAILPEAAQVRPITDTANANLPAQRSGPNELAAVWVYGAPGPEARGAGGRRWADAAPQAAH